MVMTFLTIYEYLDDLTVITNLYRKSLFVVKIRKHTNLCKRGAEGYLTAELRFNAIQIHSNILNIIMNAISINTCL